MENKINEVAFNQEMRNQRGQRDLELKSQELQANNAASEEELLSRQQSQEQIRIAQGILLSQTIESAIDVEADEEVEQLINASTEAAELLAAPLQPDWNATSREAAMSQSSHQPEITSSAAKLAQETGSPNPVSKQVKRTRGPGKSKSQAVKEREEQLSPRCASKTPSGSAKEVSSSSGETKKAKGPRTSQKATAGQQNLDESFARAQGSELSRLKN